jgi:hypothetical protein
MFMTMWLTFLQDLKKSQQPTDKITGYSLVNKIIWFLFWQICPCWCKGFKTEKPAIQTHNKKSTELLTILFYFIHD